jgi:DNA-binding CsgD family transcriptional regulator
METSSQNVVDRHEAAALAARPGLQQTPVGRVGELAQRARHAWRHVAEPGAIGTTMPARSRPCNWLLMRVLNEIDYGLMLVDERAKVYYANDLALRECSTAQALRLHQGQVSPQFDGDRNGFAKALEAARLGRRSLLRLDGSAAPLLLAVVPLRSPSDKAEEVGTLLVFGKRQVCEPLSVEFFARSHQLTNAESVVLMGLCGGLRPTQIAAQSGVAISTVRTHIGSIRVKTETASIGELLQMLTVLPPIVPALNKMWWDRDQFDRVVGV